MDIRKSCIAAALAAVAFPAVPALAATPAQQATNRALILVPLTLVKIDDLSFGTVSPSTTSLGIVSINAATGARTVFGGVTGVPSDVGNRAQFAGAGTPGQQVVITHTTPLELISTTNNADRIAVLGLTLDGLPLRTIDPVTRAFFFHMGGTIMLNPNQPEGRYEATFDVTANYL
ncbi:DUF4402 domain-containing protein [Sphingomonas lutea]|uniref:DUF4402 domain-containing protein n=1 Tax=Sphingomonas lutea TaxID=1045317 RepID=A0A7G9SIE5_9SPHN|nr:DUF4402 domain-containing protein [Sphingomonas lutea]QNN67620.1 DUF4402 domain-containing protein [Sphingomonas lutea]